MVYYEYIKGSYEVQGVHYILCSSLKCCDFSELCQFCCKRWGMIYLVCLHTLTPRENRVRNILESSKKTQYLMNTLYIPLFALYLYYLYLVYRC